MKPDPLQQVNIVWYIVPVLPIAALFYLCITGVLPSVILLLAIFLAFFWLFSLLFALYVLWRQRRSRPARKAVSS